MATSNLSGLFGDVTRTARDYDLQQLEGMLVSPAQMGAQGAGARAASLMGNRGAMTGVALNRLLGGKTSEEVRNSRINDALQKVSQGGYATEYEKMTALAQELGNMGMGAEAQQALDRAIQLQINALNIQKAQKDLEPPATRDVYDTEYVFNPITQTTEPKSIRRTEYWNPETKRYEAENPNAVKGNGDQGGDETPPPANDQQAKARAILEQRKAGGTYTNPVVTPRMPQGAPIPPDLRNQRGFQGQGMINPEGF